MSPVLPRYDSNRQLTTQQPQVFAQADPNANTLDKMAEVTGKVADMTVKWSNAVDTIQTTTAKANYETGMADILARAEADPDYNNSDKYFQEVEKLRKDSTKGMSNPAAKSRVTFELDHSSQIANIKIGGLYKKKQIVLGQA